MIYLFLTVWFALIAVPIVVWFLTKEYNKSIVRHVHEQSKTWTICPHCGNLIWLRKFTCPQCKTVNELQLPYMDRNEDVVLQQPCTNCRCPLPLVHFHGRENLNAVCPECHSGIGTQAGVFQEAVIPIVGSRSSGKSAYLAALTYQLQKKFGNRLSFPFPGLAVYAEKCNSLFVQGIVPEQTPLTLRPNSFTVDIQNNDADGSGMRLFFYDPAGEIFNKEDRMHSLPFFDIMDELIILVDPFSIPEVCSQYANFSQHQPGEGNFSDNVDRIRNGMYKYRYKNYDYGTDTDEDHVYCAAGQKHFARCAVVITKSDALINDTDIQSLLHSQDSSRMHNVCRQKLGEWGIDDNIGKLETMFEEVQCFCVSSFGHTPDARQPFTPQCVELPLLWFLRQRDI